MNKVHTNQHYVIYRWQSLRKTGLFLLGHKKTNSIKIRPAGQSGFVNITDETKNNAELLP